MGCLFEILGELFVEMIIHGYIALMQLIVPGKIVSEKAKGTMKKIVTVIASVFVVVMIVGLILFVQADPLIKTIGKYMTFIPLAVSALQIAVGLIVKLVERL